MYYFFQKKDKFLKEFEQIKENRTQGKSPVFNEMRAVRTDCFEFIPYNSVRCVFLLLGAWVIGKFTDSVLFQIAGVTILNNCTCMLTNIVVVSIKHWFRCRFLCKRGIEPTEENISILESMEYQTI